MPAPNPRPSLSRWQGAIAGGIGGLIASLLPEDPSLFVVYLHGFGAGFLASAVLAAVFLLLDRGPPSFRRCKLGTCDAIGGRTKKRVQLETARAAPYLVPDQLPSLRNGRVTGEVRSRIVPDVSGASLRKAMAEQIDFAGSHLHTDGWKAYKGIGQGFLSHQWVDHSDGEYVRGDVSTNMVEGYFSQLKRSLDGTHHRVSREHLGRYLAEFDFRYSSRKLSDTQRMHRLMGQVGGRRLTYKRVTTS